MASGELKRDPHSALSRKKMESHLFTTLINATNDWENGTILWFYIKGDNTRNKIFVFCFFLAWSVRQWVRRGISDAEENLERFRSAKKRQGAALEGSAGNVGFRKQTKRNGCTRPRQEARAVCTLQGAPGPSRPGRAETALSALHATSPRQLLWSVNAQATTSGIIYAP